MAGGMFEISAQKAFALKNKFNSSPATDAISLFVLQLRTARETQNANKVDPFGWPNLTPKSGQVSAGDGAIRTPRQMRLI